MDDSLRAAEAGSHSAPGSFYSALEQIREARLAFQQGDVERAIDRVHEASGLVERPATVHPKNFDPNQYRGATVIDPSGAMLGEVTSVSDASFEIALGGWRRVGLRRSRRCPSCHRTDGLARLRAADVAEVPARGGPTQGLLTAARGSP
jgi:hypothetical protein